MNTVKTKVSSDGENVQMYITPSDYEEFLTECNDTNVRLVPGTKIEPQSNYVYINKETKRLNVNIDDWPEEDHIKISYLYIQDAITVKGYIKYGLWGRILRFLTPKPKRTYYGGPLVSQNWS